MTDGLIVGIHDSNRSLCLSGRESLLGQERSKGFVFREKGLSPGAARAVTRVVSFLATSPAVNLTRIISWLAEEDPDVGLNATRVGPEVALLAGIDGFGLE